MGDEADQDQEMPDAFDEPGLPANGPANGELRNGDAPAAANQEAVLEILISVDGLPCGSTYNIQGGSSFTKFIEGLRRLLAEHPESERLYDGHEDTTLKSSEKYPLLAKPRVDQQPEMWIEVKLQVSGQQGKGATSSSTTLVVRNDNVDVMGFSNHKGVWYELGNNRRRRMLPLRYNNCFSSKRKKPRYNNPELLEGSWVIDKEKVANLLVESSTCLGKTFAADAVRVLSCYPELVADGVDPRLALVGLSVMVCDSARMNPVHDAIADGWDTGARFTEQFVTGTMGNYEWMSRGLWQWSRRKYVEPHPTTSQLQAVCLVLNGPPEVVYTIADEVSFISFMIDLRRKLSDHPDREDILNKHEDRNLSSTHEHPLLPRQRAPYPERWIHVKLQVVEGDETSWTTLIMRDDNLYVNGFINQKGVVYGLADKNRGSVVVLRDPYNYHKVQRLEWSVQYKPMLKAASNDDVMTKLAEAHLGREFAMKAVRVLSRYPEHVAAGDDNPKPRLALAGLVFMFCESARMNPLHNAIARGWRTGTGFSDELMSLHVWNYSKKSGELQKWKSERYYLEPRRHPIKELQDVYLVLNTHQSDSTTTTEEAAGGDGRGGSPSQQPRESGGNNAGGSSGSSNQPGKSGDAGSTGGGCGSGDEPGHSGPGRGNSGSQPQQDDHDADNCGGPLVELLAIHADLRVLGTKIIVYDGIRGQIIYRKEEQRKHIKEQKEQGEQAMDELVLTGPYTCISAYGCFAIQIDIPADGAAGGSKGDAGGLIEWEWDCYDPKYGGEVDKPPVTRTIGSSGPGRNIEVTYAVMSNALEATVQVMFWLKDGHDPSDVVVQGEITARIQDFEVGSVLFSRTQWAGHCFSHMDGSCFRLELARNVVAVPCGSKLHIRVKLGTKFSNTEAGKDLDVTLDFDNGTLARYHEVDGEKVVEVKISWYPKTEMATAHRPEQFSEAVDEQKIVSALEPSHPAEEFGRKINSMEKESHRISHEPQKIPFKLLAEITDGFSEKAKIGSGAFGQVYKGVLKNGTVIAVKKLRFMPEGFNNKQFENELSHLKGLKHENIVQILGFCDETEQEIRPCEGRLVVADIIHRILCLEFVPNGSLGKILSEKFTGHNWPVRFKIIKGICVGLKYLHDSGIMHFDLKPDNILLDDKMVPKIADFGISRLAASGELDTVSLLGTLGFMPPEFISKGIISKHFDIFSLGVIIKRIVVSGLSDYMSFADMEDQAFIEHVHDSWKKLQETSSYASLEVDSKQVRTCIEIGVACMEADRYKRPTMQDIMCKLKEVETTEVGDSRSQIEEIHKGDIPKTQDPGKVVSIHKEVPSEMATGTGGSLISVLPKQLPSQFVKNITEGFSSERVIARGASGTYYKGFLEDGSVISVKKIEENSPEKQFYNEVSNLMGISHENIMKLIGFCRETQKKVIEHNGRYIIVDVLESYLCYEYARNGSLGKYISGESRIIDWATCFNIIKGICQGLHYLNKEMDRPLVHMNLVPDNIWLDDNMVPKIAEFGLSRLFGEEQTRMNTINLVGANGYMAPEYLYRGEISMHSDIYSLGLIIMETATREKNMRNDEDMSGRNFIDNVRKNWTSDEHIASKYPSLDVGSLHQVKECITIGLRCVEIDRKNRPSITEILDVLDGKRADY